MIALLLTSLLASTKADDAAAGGAEAEQDAAGNDESSAEPQPIVLNCHPADLLEPLVTWSVDCTAQWIENMGFGELKTAFMGNNVDGKALESLTLSALETNYGLSDEDDRKKIIYSIKDILKKDNYRGNTNDWQNFFMWLLPIAGVAHWLSMKYEKQIAKLMKKYRKWQEARAPPKPLNSEPVPEGEKNDWIDGINSDITRGEKKKTKKTKKVQ